MVKVELKPCPFCGGKALLQVWNKGIRVICFDCMCSTPSFQDDAWDDNGNYYDADENKVVPCALIRAVKKWNRRA